MRVLQVKCPQCGAVLDPGDDVEKVTCTYCGATAVVERAAPPVREVPEAASEGDGAPRAAEARRTRKVVNVVVSLIVLGGLVAVGLMAYLGHRQAEQARAAAEWYGTTRALLADVTGDGVPEVVGRIRRLGADPIRESLAALDARTGRKLWETPALPKLDGPYHTLAAAAGDLLLFVDPGGTARAFGLADGKSRWEAALGEAAAAVFVLPDGSLHVRTIDGTLHGLAPDGRTVSLEEGGPPGRRVPADTDEAESAFGAMPHELSTTLQERGMSATAALGGGAPGEALVVLGHRARGTAVPMLAETSGDGAVLWTSDVPGVDPLSAQSGILGSEQVAVEPGRVFAVYERGSAGTDGVLQVTAFERTTGRRLWEVELPDAAPVSGLTAGGRVLYVSYWGQLAALDAATGERLFLASPIR